MTQPPEGENEVSVVGLDKSELPAVDPVGAARTRLEKDLGVTFLQWVLGEPDDELTASQVDVLTLLHQVRSMHEDVPSGLPRHLMIAQLTGYNAAAAMATLNALRLHANGDLPEQPSATDDEVLDALHRLAIDVYGELLLAGNDTLGALTSPYTSQAGSAVVAAVRKDPELPFGDDQEEDSAIDVARSTGSAGTLQLSAVGTSIILAAWELASTDQPVPTVHELLNRLPEVLQSSRDAWSRKPAETLGLASLTGALLPQGCEISLSWGRLRPARDSDHPESLRGALADRKTVSTSEDGTQVVISDAGDIVVEVRAPLEIRRRDGESPALPSWVRLGPDELERRIAQVRLAHLLAAADGRRRVLLPVWRRFIEPLTQGRGWAYSDPGQFAMRTPEQLTQAEADAWREWIQRLDSVDLSKLGVAPQRLLRAVGERRDPYDTLIDAVIAWEALFASNTEATLRVAGSVARLLKKAGDERVALRSHAAEIYNLRSQVVHGGDADAVRVSQASTDAIDLAVSVLRVLVEKRPDLIPLKGADRSTALLME